MKDREADPGVQQDILNTKELCANIVVQIPYRSNEGINPKLLEYAIPWVNSGVAMMPYRDCFGGFVDILRSHMVTEFLRETERKYLVMIDNDVVPMDNESILRLCSHGLPVVSGIACAFRPGTGSFACIAVKDKTGVARFPTVMDTKVIPAYGIREIESCGAGIIAIRRDVLESLKEPAFLLPQALRVEAASIGTLRKTEDIYFCEQVQKAGFKLYADFSVHCFHDKTIPLLWPRENIDSELDPEEWDVTSSAYAAERR